MPEKGTVLCFDFGERRIGVAVGELEVRQSHALTVIVAERKDDRFSRIRALIKEWAPVFLLVGDPRHMDGTPHEITERCRRFTNQLHGRFGLPVFQFDERLTSIDAEHRLRETGLNSRQARPLVDAVAAQLILQGYFDALPAERTATRPRNSA